MTPLRSPGSVLIVDDEAKIRQLLAKVEAAGYRAVRKIEREHDEVEVSADDAQGQRVKLRLDPQTGALKSSGR